MQEETTNQILQELQTDIMLEVSDARGRRDGSDVALMRLANAINRNLERRAAREQADVGQG